MKNTIEPSVSNINTIPEFLEKISRNWSSRPAVSDFERTLSYKELSQRIGRKRTFVKSLGLEPCSRIAILDITSIDELEMFLAITTSGYSAVMLPSDSPEEFTLERIISFNVRAVATGVQIDSSFINKALPSLTVFSTEDIADQESPVQTVSTETEAAIFLVPGDTPKGAVFSHKAISHGAYNACFTPEPVNGICRVVSTAPLFRVFGLVTSTLSTLFQGGEWFCGKSLKDSLFKLESAKPTKLFLVPGLCEIVLAKIRMYGIEGFASSLETVVCCESSISQSSIDEFEKYRIRVVTAYGITEAGGLITVNRELPAHSASAGKPIQGIEIKVEDGEILLRSNSLFSGYTDGENTMTDDAWFRTGDLGEIDEEGRLSITGRKNGLIVLASGEKISPSSIERLFKPYLEEINECEIKEDTFNGERIVLAEILSGAAPERIKEIVDQVNLSLPAGKRIMKYVIR